MRSLETEGALLLPVLTTELIELRIYLVIGTAMVESSILEQLP